MSTLNVSSLKNSGSSDVNIGLNTDGTTTLAVIASNIAPAITTTGALWLDTTVPASPVLKVYNGTASAWVAAGSAGSVPPSPTPPVSPVIGDIYYDTSTTPGVLKVYNGTAFVPVSTTPASTGAPASPQTGTTWYDTASTPPVLKVWNGTAWVPAGNTTASGTQPTSPAIGQTWYDTASTPPVLKVWNGSAWVPAGNTNASGTAPLNPSDGQLWYDTSVSPDTLKVYNATLATWVAINGSGGVNNVSATNTAVGYDALDSNTGTDNTAFGQNALTANVAGIANVAVGSGAGSLLTSGNNNTFLGSYVGVAGMTDTIAISSGATPKIVVNDLGDLHFGGTTLLTNPNAKLTDAGEITVTSQNGGQLAGFRNLLINGNFGINQRVYVSGTAVGAANTYTVDRWKVLVSGQSLAFAASGNGNQITAPAGGVQQVIEDANVGGGVYTLSWAGTATADVNGSAVSNGAQVTLPANTQATVTFSGGTVSNAQLEPGTKATPFEQRLIGTELTLCQRYYNNFTPQSPWSSAFDSQAGIDWCRLAFQIPVRMRTSPSVTTTGSFIGTPNNAVGPYYNFPVTNAGASVNNGFVQLTYANGKTLQTAGVGFSMPGLFLSAEL